MYLHYFPVDEQSCPLQFGSYAYTDDQMRYIWKYGQHNSVKAAKDMRLSQFDLIGYPTQNLTILYINGKYSALKVHFRLQRHMGFFLIQVYVPCTLIVVLSWVSFWINREATADRVSLGITSVLTLTTLTLDSRKELPQVPYATALDWFILVCFGFIIASLLEFAGVHYFTKRCSGETPHAWEALLPDVDTDDGDLDEIDEVKINCDTDHINELKDPPTYVSVLNNTANYSQRITDGIYSDQHSVPQSHNPNKRESCFYGFLKCLQGSWSYRRMLMARTTHHKVNSVSKIDRVARFLFPLSFTAINIFYWVSYVQYNV